MTDNEYFFRRAAQEREAERQAQSRVAQQAHRDLAERYEALAAGSGSTTGLAERRYSSPFMPVPSERSQVQNR
jgi:hypothetical protein